MLKWGPTMSILSYPISKIMDWSTELYHSITYTVIMVFSRRGDVLYMFYFNNSQLLLVQYFIIILY